MSPNIRLRNRTKVLLNMVMAFVIAILFAQLWLLTVTLEAMDNREASVQVAAAALICSSMGFGAVWALIRVFLRAEENSQ